MTTSTPAKKFMRTMLVLLALAGATFFTAACDYIEKTMDANAIETVLEKDAKAGNIYLDSSSATRYLSSMNARVSNMRIIDLSDCPSEFQIAYVAHVGAWQKQLIVAKEIKTFDDRYNSFSGFFEAFLRGMVFDFGISKECAEELRIIKEHESEALNAISSTWNKVLAVAIKYGVNVTKYQ